MQPIPQNLRSLYDDVSRRVLQATVRPASIVQRKSKGYTYLHAVVRDGTIRKSVYLGRADDPDVVAHAEQYRRARRQSRDTKISIQALTRSGPAISPVYGRVLEVLANAALFDQGLVLVGTLAFQQYSWLLGVYLNEGAARTDDADFSITRFAAGNLKTEEPFEQILQRADASFQAQFVQTDRLPSTFASDSIAVKLLTTRGRADVPLQIKPLQAAAVPLKFMEYLITDPLRIVALYGTGVPILVPDPARYAVHKLLIKREAYSGKTEKDRVQAREIFTIMGEREPERLSMAVEDARRRGAEWAKRLDAGLKLIAR